MSTWAARMHRRAATFSNVVTSCGHPSGPYPRRLEKVKFGVPLEEVCKNDIPGPLLVLILKLNKEAPYRKDVFRAPGHQGAMKKLIHFLQTGRLVNMDNFSVYTIASVLKKFLRKVPGGIFGKDIEQEFFQVIEFSDLHLQRDEIHRIITSLPRYTQKLLVLLFGTFRVIASNSEKAGTGMTSEALGVSVAPSFFHSCVSDGKTAKMEDVMKFKVASRVMKHLIEEFASSNLFGKDNYEYYARVTGRVLRVQGEWICSFQYPPTKGVFPNEYVALERYLLAMSQGEECQSTPALLEVGLQPQVNSSSLGMIAEHTLLESCTRLSISLEQNGLFQVHERQTERMKTRSQWFLGPSVDCSSCGGSLDIPLNKADVSALTNALLRRSSSGTIVGVAGLSLSAESIQKRPSIKRANSRDKRYVQRSASRRNKENGSRSSSFKGRNERRGSGSRSNSFKIKYDNISRSCSFKNKGELCSCPVEGSSALENGNKEDNLPLDTAKTKETICVTLTYKPRI
ncbi:rho GTPase activating protein at 71E isoform X2 [Rhynchophorus ferrugineus]|uniref:rho GTPase activating protein at 71E isoform X2 n=1 Tax=Rhynchophorus ferrugineus TaxID=354439 RepID=UPI003FCEBEC8